MHRSSARRLHHRLLGNAHLTFNGTPRCGLANHRAGVPSGRRINRSTNQRFNGTASSGITLIELLVVVAIIGLMMAITFPTLTTGLDGFRLAGAVDRAGTLFQQARLEADRRQQPVQVTADPRRNELRALAADASWRETLEFKDGLRIVFPAGVQNWMLYPSTPPPQVRLMLEAQTGSQRGFSINIFTGVAEDWKAAP